MADEHKMTAAALLSDADDAKGTKRGLLIAEALVHALLHIGDALDRAITISTYDEQGRSESVVGVQGK